MQKGQVALTQLPQAPVNGLQQVIALVVAVEVEVRVADDAEQVRSLDDRVWEQRLDVGLDDVLDEDERQYARRRQRRRQLHEPRQVARHFHARELGAAPVLHRHRQVRAQVGDERERVPGVERERSQHRENVPREVLPQVGLDLRRPLMRVQEHDPLVGELAPEAVPRGSLLVEHFVGDAAHLVQLRRHVEPVRRMILDALAELPHRCRQPDHEELVEIGAGDAEELDPLEQRMRGVGDLGQDAAVELEPAQLAVDVQRRVLEVLGVDGVESSLLRGGRRVAAIHTMDGD